jgi:hypothetical protein
MYYSPLLRYLPGAGERRTTTAGVACHETTASVPEPGWPVS